MSTGMIIGISKKEQINLKRRDLCIKEDKIT